MQLKVRPTEDLLRELLDPQTDEARKWEIIRFLVCLGLVTHSALTKGGFVAFPDEGQDDAHNLNSTSQP